MEAGTFASRLKALREGAGLSQKALAAAAGLATSAIGHLEQGLRKPAWETVLALGKALGVPCTAFQVEEGAQAVEAPRKPGRPRKAVGEGEEKPVPKQRRKRT
jgi:transcriptional regulator with XRE-family HTH domain